MEGAGRAWVAVAGAADVPPGTAKCVAAGDVEVALFNVGGELHAVQAGCPHKGGPLAEGFVRDGVVTCPWHWWRFDLRTGERLGTVPIRLERYGVRYSGGRIEVCVPPPAPARSMRDILLEHARRGGPAREGT